MNGVKKTVTRRLAWQMRAKPLRGRRRGVEEKAHAGHPPTRKLQIILLPEYPDIRRLQLRSATCCP